MLIDLENLAPNQSAGLSIAKPVVAIVGATGAVGVELLNCLSARNFPLGGLKLLASARSAGKTVEFNGAELVIEELTEASFEGVDIALFSAGSGISKRFAPLAVKAGAVVIDNSSAFRMEAAVPLVVPEVNAEALGQHRGIIANPNCVAAIATVALAPLHRAHPIRRLNISTYQAASGAGAAAMEELRLPTASYLAGEAFEPKVLPHPYAFNLFSHNADMDPESGYNGEEPEGDRRDPPHSRCARPADRHHLHPRAGAAGACHGDLDRVRPAGIARRSPQPA